MGDKNTNIISSVEISTEANYLIEKFEKKLHETLLSEKFTSPYSSIDDILIKKYHLSNIDKIEAPDYACKTEFITKGVRGNLQKAEGNILTYDEAEILIDKAINEVLP